MSLIQCRRLSRIYKRGVEEIRPLDELDLEIEAGGFVALMGPSGSGKTTLLNLLAGIDRPTSGELEIGGRSLGDLSRNRLAEWRSEHVGYVFQLYNLVPVLTAYENIELPLLLQPISSAERHRRVSAALDVVGISDRHAHYPDSSPAARNNAWRSPGPSSRNRLCCSPTNRPGTSIGSLPPR